MNLDLEFARYDRPSNIFECLRFIRSKQRLVDHLNPVQMLLSMEMNQPPINKIGDPEFNFLLARLFECLCVEPTYVGRMCLLSNAIRVADASDSPVLAGGYNPLTHYIAVLHSWRDQLHDAATADEFKG